jgi:hypothetical protein
MRIIGSRALQIVIWSRPSRFILPGTHEVMFLCVALGRFSRPASSGLKGIKAHTCSLERLSQLPVATMFYKILSVLALAVAYAAAEQHIVSFDNR